jgi:hypothetical protein
MAKKHAQEKDAEDFIPHFARFGYIAKGVTYVLMAFFAGHAALGNGRAANTQRAMGSLDGAFIGHVVLLAIACGLASYALWRFYTAFADPENDTWTKRISSIFIGLVNAGLAWQAALLAITRRGGSNADQAVQWSAVVMRYPAGIYATGIAGLCFAAYGLRQIYRGIISKLDDQMRWHKMDHAPRRSAIIACRIGIAARGFVFVLIGFFLVRAARTADPSQARDFGDSLMELQDQPYGRWLLFIVAAGLLAYAVYEFIRARYRHIPTA